MSASTYDRGQKISEMDTAGVITTFSEFDTAEGHMRRTFRAALESFDDLGTIPEMTTDSISDGAGRTIIERTGSPGLPNRVRTTLYDSRGRVKEVAEGGDDPATRLVTTTSYDGLGTTVTLPGGVTQVSESYLDGQTKSTGGTGTVAETKTYALAGSLIRETTRRGSATQYVESITESNGLGMLIREKTASPTEGWRSFTYDSAGRRTSEKLGDDTLATYSYPAPETTVTTRLAAPDPARTHTQTQTYVKQGGAWWRVSTAGGASQWEKVSGLGWADLSATRAIDADGRESSSVATVEFTSQAIITYTSAPGVSLPAVSSSKAGLVVRTVAPDLSITDTTYDSFGRPLETTASDTGLHTTFTYDPVTGQVGTQRSWSGAATYADATDRSETVNFYHTETEALGQLSSRNVDGVVTSFAYTPRGELPAQWGATYPVRYEYDDAGRIWKLHTFRTPDPSGTPLAYWSMGDVTEWVYYPGTELILIVLSLVEPRSQAPLGNALSQKLCFGPVFFPFDGILLPYGSILLPDGSILF